MKQAGDRAGPVGWDQHSGQWEFNAAQAREGPSACVEERAHHQRRICPCAAQSLWNRSGEERVQEAAGVWIGWSQERPSGWRLCGPGARGNRSCENHGTQIIARAVLRRQLHGVGKSRDPHIAVVPPFQGGPTAHLEVSASGCAACGGGLTPQAARLTPGGRVEGARNMRVRTAKARMSLGIASHAASTILAALKSGRRDEASTAFAVHHTHPRFLFPVVVSIKSQAWSNFTRQ
jgi:hypothetical protein